jgi:hypothetical protein
MCRWLLLNARNSLTDCCLRLAAAFLTPCRRATQKCVLALPCVVDGSRNSTFSYTSSCTCVWHLIWLTYRFKFIVSLMQDVGSQVTFKRPGNWMYLIKRPSGRQIAVLSYFFVLLFVRTINDGCRTNRCLRLLFVMDQSYCGSS